MSLIVEMAKTGGPQVLVAREATIAAPGPDEVRLRQEAIGVNFVDIYHRTGLYALSRLPAVPGVEGAGIVEAVGAGVTDLRPGDRVAYAGLPAGGYAAVRCLPAGRLVPLPDGIDTRTAAAAMLRGVTAHMLLTRVFPVTHGTTVLVHAAAGGLGLILTQWAKALGATVLGTIGSQAKAAIAVEAGLDHAILYRECDFAAEVRRLTGGRGVDYAIDGIGGDTLLRTLDAVRPFGTVASIGQASGGLPAIALGELGPRRSLALARPSVFAYAADEASYRAACTALFDRLAGGLRISVGAEFPLSDAAAAQRALEAGETTGSVLLRP